MASSSVHGASKPVKRKYSSPRKAIPEVVKREVRIEAQYACIVCNSNTVEYAHIDGNRDNHTAENLALLCPTHHKQFDDGNIPRKDIVEMKARKKVENQELIKVKQQLDYVLGAKHVSISSDFGQLKMKYQNLLNDYSDKLIFYQSFIYLIPEFYLDARGEDVRAVVRDLLGLTPEEEHSIIDHLIRMDLIETVGDLAALKNTDDAKTALNELIKSGKVDITQITAAFVGI